MKYTVSFRNLYGNVEVANIEATAFEILDRALCFYRSKNNPDLDIPQEDVFFLAFNDWIHVSEAKEEVVSDKPN